MPNRLLSSLPCQKEGGWVLVNEFLQIPDWPGVWAVGDCALAPDLRQPGKSHPPTAQHAIREGRVAAQNIALALAGCPPKRFSFKTIGLLPPSAAEQAWRGFSASTSRASSRGGYGARFTWANYLVWTRSFTSQIRATPVRRP